MIVRFVNLEKNIVCIGVYVVFEIFNYDVFYRKIIINDMIVFYDLFIC